MSNEAQVRASIEINATNLKHRTWPTDFKANVDGEKGPSPGAMTVAAAGTSVDLSELTQPGFCIIRNLDAAIAVDVGIWDGTEFYPLLEVQSGEHYLYRFSKWLGRSFGSGVGTGTHDTGTYSLMIRPQENDTVNVVVEAFEA